MPFHYLKTNQPAALIFYAPWAVIAWLPHLLQITEIQYFNFFPYGLIPFEIEMAGWVQVLGGFICITLQAFQFNRIINQTQLLGRESYLHGPVYILVASMAYPAGAINGQMLSMFFILPALGRWWLLAEQRNALQVCFNSAFLVSLASILYLPNALLLVQAFISLMVFRTFNAREALYVLLGFALPQLFWFTLGFVLQWDWIYWYNQFTIYHWNDQTEWLVWQIATGTLLLFALLYYLSVTPNQIIRIRKMRQLVFSYLLLAMAAQGLFYTLTQQFSFPFLAIVPAAIFISGFINMPLRASLPVLFTYVVWFIFLYASCKGLINSY